jgi:D-glycero-D-manno-heptose 1,7-bisphosphate phosphatase
VKGLVTEKRALFLDRDGTLIEDVGYPSDPALVKLLRGAAAVLRDARARGVLLVIVTNQSGVGRGMFDEATARRVQARVEELFAAEGVTFDGVYYCFHGPNEGCACRKPAPGMLLSAAAELGIDLARSIMIGDKASDVEAGAAAGCASIRFAGAWADLAPKLAPL